jgi:hypothetical protein
MVISVRVTMAVWLSWFVRSEEGAGPSGSPVSMRYMSGM